MIDIDLDLVRNIPLDVVETLAKLGTTADEIAQTLANKGIQGSRADASHCPLTNYLVEQGFVAWTTTKAIFINIEEMNLDSQLIYTGSAHATDSIVEVFLGTTLEEFVMKFDRGDYPELNAGPFYLQDPFPEVDVLSS